MKKLILAILLLTSPAWALDGQHFQVNIDGTQFYLAFGVDTALLTDDGFLETVLSYQYAEPFGTLEGIPFHTYQGYLILITDSLILSQYTPEPEPEPEPDLLDLSKVKWLHTDVSGWKRTATLSSIKFGTSTLTLNYDKACAWPGVNIGGIDLNANPWVFVQLDGIWYGATWEWLKVCQTMKGLYAVDGSHIKVPPLDNWKPVSGETYYFMVSGLARQTQRNAKERSNLLKIIWP